MKSTQSALRTLRRRRLEHQNGKRDRDRHRRDDGDELPFDRHPDGIEKARVAEQSAEIGEADIDAVGIAELAVLQRDIDGVDRSARRPEPRGPPWSAR